MSDRVICGSVPTARRRDRPGRSRSVVVVGRLGAGRLVAQVTSDDTPVAVVADRVGVREEIGDDVREVFACLRDVVAAASAERVPQARLGVTAALIDDLAGSVT